MAKTLLPPPLFERGVVNSAGHRPRDLAGLEAAVRLAPGMGLQLLDAGAQVCGISRAQLERVVQSCGLRTADPPIGWFQKLGRSALGVEGLHCEVDDMGLPIAFGQCVVDFSPGPLPGVTVDVARGIDPEDLPSRFLPDIERGIRAALAEGTEGAPILGVCAVIQDGRYDMLESTPEHFEAAGAAAVVAAVQRAGTIVLEPWERVTFEVSAAHLSSAIQAVAASRGRLIGVDNGVAAMALTAEVPRLAWADLIDRLERLGVEVRAADRRQALPRPRLERVAAY
jgi:hypothetical protein